MLLRTRLVAFAHCDGHIRSSQRAILYIGQCGEEGVSSVRKGPQQTQKYSPGEMARKKQKTASFDEISVSLIAAKQLERNVCVCVCVIINVS